MVHKGQGMFNVEKQCFHWRHRKVNGREINSCVRILIGGLLVFASAVAPSAPQLSSVVEGAASVSVKDGGQRTVIDQASPYARIEWNSFDTTAAETVRFNQANSAVVVNKILGNGQGLGGATRFDGKLFAAGTVFLINNAGITFGANAQVNVGALLATTSDIGDPHNANGKVTFRLEAGGTVDGARVVNRGSIVTSDGGFAVLMAPQVANVGVVRAQLGQVILASATDATLRLRNGDAQEGLDALALDLRGDGIITFTVDPSTLGAWQGDSGVRADGRVRGREVLITARMAHQAVTDVVNLDGVIDATTIEVQSAGNVRLHEAQLTARANRQSGNAEASIRVSADRRIWSKGSTLQAMANRNGGTGRAKIVLDSAGHASLNDSQLSAQAENNGGAARAVVRVGSHGAGLEMQGTQVTATTRNNGGQGEARVRMSAAEDLLLRGTETAARSRQDTQRGIVGVGLEAGRDIALDGAHIIASSSQQGARSDVDVQLQAGRSVRLPGGASASMIKASAQGTDQSGRVAVAVQAGRHIRLLADLEVRSQQQGDAGNRRATAQLAMRAGEDGRGNLYAEGDIDVQSVARVEEGSTGSAHALSSAQLLGAGGETEVTGALAVTSDARGQGANTRFSRKHLVEAVSEVLIGSDAGIGAPADGANSSRDTLMAGSLSVRSHAVAEGNASAMANSLGGIVGEQVTVVTTGTTITSQAISDLEANAVSLLGVVGLGGVGSLPGVLFSGDLAVHSQALSYALAAGEALSLGLFVSPADMRIGNAGNQVMIQADADGVALGGLVMGGDIAAYGPSLGGGLTSADLAAAVNAATGQGDLALAGNFGVNAGANGRNGPQADALMAGIGRNVTVAPGSKHSVHSQAAGEGMASAHALGGFRADGALGFHGDWDISALADTAPGGNGSEAVAAGVLQATGDLMIDAGHLSVRASSNRSPGADGRIGIADASLALATEGQLSLTVPQGVRVDALSTGASEGYAFADLGIEGDRLSIDVSGRGLAVVADAEAARSDAQATADLFAFGADGTGPALSADGHMGVFARAGWPGATGSGEQALAMADLLLAADSGSVETGAGSDLLVSALGHAVEAATGFTATQAPIRAGLEVAGQRLDLQGGIGSEVRNTAGVDLAEARTRLIAGSPGAPGQLQLHGGELPRAQASGFGTALAQGSDSRYQQCESGSCDPVTSGEQPWQPGTQLAQLVIEDHQPSAPALDPESGSAPPSEGEIAPQRELARVRDQQREQEVPRDPGQPGKRSSGFTPAGDLIIGLDFELSPPDVGRLVSLPDDFDPDALPPTAAGGKEAQVTFCDQLVNGGCNPVPEGWDQAPGGSVLLESTLCSTVARPEGEVIEEMETSCVWKV